MTVRIPFFGLIGTLIAGVALVTIVSAQTKPPADLVAALRQGGYVMVMRHASSPREVPTAQTANADNQKLERQLDEAGRAGATAMGQALRDLKIPVGDVLSSPTYRALQTVRFAQLANPMPIPELGDGGQSMKGIAEADAAWLRAKVAEAPTRGNTILVTHMPNVAQAFPAWGSLADGETIVVRPDRKGGMTLMGRVKIEEWPRLR
jgi:phosphohistidine phosphatase SixA